MLDRVVRGRAWIPLLGVMLAGIVAMQVEVLKLGASMGRSIERGTALQSRNELLRQSVATLADDQRIERLAAQQLGMVMPAPDGVGFLSAHPGASIQQAVSNIHAPDAPGFLALVSSNGAVATGLSNNGSSSASSAATQVSSPQSSTAPTQVQATTTSQGASSQGPSSQGATSQGASSQGATSQGAAPSQSASSSGAPAGAPVQTASAGGAAAPAQVVPTQTSSSQTSSSGSGGAAVPTGG